MCIRCIVLLLCACACSAAGLRVEIARGNDVNNRAGSRGSAPGVRVTDEDGKPVTGALAIFTAPSSGPSLDFANGPVAQTTSDDSGLAMAPAPRPVGGNGPVRIEVLVAKDGATANAAIDEMNLGFSSTGVSGGVAAGGDAFGGGVAGDMEIVAAPDSGAPRAQGGKRVLRVRVTDTAGKPVAGATLSIRLYPDRNSVQEMSAQSHADGTADFQLDAKLLKGLTQIPVTAAAQGVTATRVVDVAQVP